MPDVGASSSATDTPHAAARAPTRARRAILLSIAVVFFGGIIVAQYIGMRRGRRSACLASAVFGFLIGARRPARAAMSGKSNERRTRRVANRTLLRKLGVVVVVMFGFGFALVPFYDQICEATGLRDIDTRRRGQQHAGRRDAHGAHRVRRQRAQAAVDVSAR